MSKRNMFWAVAPLLLLMLPTAVFAATGTEAITLSTYSASVIRGNGVAITFFVNRTSGYYTYPTVLAIVDSSQFSSNNIQIIIPTNQTYGNAPFTGTLHIFAAHNATIGNFTIKLTGASSGVTVEPALLSLEVLSNASAASTLTTTSVAPVSTANTTNSTTPINSTTATTTRVATIQPTITIAPTTTVQQQTQNNGSEGWIAATIVVIVAAGIIYYLLMRGGPKAKASATQH